MLGSGREMGRDRKTELRGHFEKELGKNFGQNRPGELKNKGPGG